MECTTGRTMVYAMVCATVRLVPRGHHAVANYGTHPTAHSLFHGVCRGTSHETCHEVRRGILHDLHYRNACPTDSCTSHPVTYRTNGPTKHPKGYVGEPHGVQMNLFRVSHGMRLTSCFFTGQTME